MNKHSTSKLHRIQIFTPEVAVNCSISLSVPSLTDLALQTVPLTTTVVVYALGLCRKLIDIVYCCCSCCTRGEDESGDIPVTGSSNMNTNGSSSCNIKS